MDGEVVVARFDAPHEAELAANYLREHGVKARVDNEVLIGMNPLWGNALGGIRLFVTDAKAESASKLLEELARAQPAPDDDAEPFDDRREFDAIARRALVAAVIGTFLLPIIAHLYSLKLALPLPNAKLTPRGRRHQAIAVVIDSLVIGLFVYVLFA